jgi:Ran GTPase-activating protein (RanGAP) involved in mRNA processing and transport
VIVVAVICGNNKSEPLPRESEEDTTLEEITSIYDDIDMDSEDSDDSDDENSDDENSDDENSDDDSKDLFDQFLDIIKD